MAQPLDRFGDYTQRFYDEFLKQPLDEATNFEADLLALQNLPRQLKLLRNRSDLATQNTNLRPS